MIPDFNKDGNLPSGIHESSLDEVEYWFANNFKRKFLFKHLKILIEDLKKIGCKTIYIDGSFVTKKEHPGDIDICWDNRNLDMEDIRKKFPILFDFSNGRYNQKKIYQSDIFPAFIMESDSGKLFIDFFQTDKNTGIRKGIIMLNI